MLAARAAGYEAPGGAVVVMDPNNGDIVGMASFPTYNPRLLADGITQKEWDKLGQKTPKDNSDDRLLNRAIQSGVPPGSTFKVVTAGAALATDVASTSTYLPCPGAWEYRGVTFPNWTSADFGTIGFPTSLEISCDTFYYQLGARLEEAFGPEESAGGDNTERFQKYMRLAGFGHETGIDLPNEFDGTVPDKEWCEENRTIGYCPDGWLPGYTVNMSIGQGDLRVTPLQMAVTFGALANGGNVMRPRLGVAVGEPTENGKERVVREFEPEIVSKLPLDAAEIGAIEQGLEAVVASGNGTAASAFAGFPLEEYPIAGKTGTAQIGETDLNYAWFTSYGPTHDPGYVVSVYLERAGHGGESAAPIAR